MKKVFFTVALLAFVGSAAIATAANASKCKMSVLCGDDKKGDDKKKDKDGKCCKKGGKCCKKGEKSGETKPEDKK